MTGLSKRSGGACIAVLPVGLLAGGGDWVQFGAGSGLNGDNAGETAITASNPTVSVTANPGGLEAF